MYYTTYCWKYRSYIFYLLIPYVFLLLDLEFCVERYLSCNERNLWSEDATKINALAKREREITTVDGQ